MTIIPRRAVLHAAALALTLPALAQPAPWPTRPVRVIVPVAPGGVSDSSIRAISERLSALLGQPMVVENRSGAGSTIGAGAVAAARPDGGTFLIDSFNHVINPHLIRGLPFDYVTAFAPVAQIARIPLVLAVRPDLPAADLPAFIALAAERTGGLFCGNSGNGTAAHLSSALLQSRSGKRWTDVAYRGGSDAARDLAGCTLDCAFVSLLSALPLVAGGRARVLAVTGPARSALMPEVPTVAEAGFPGYALEEWIGLFAPAGTPDTVLDRMASTVAQALRDPVVAARLAQLGAEPVGSSRPAFAAFVAAGREEAARIAAEARIEAN